VDPLAEPFGLSVLPDGLLPRGELMVLAPAVLPVPMPVVPLPVDDPLMAAPPVEVPAPAPAAPPAWASANVLDKANADARTIVLIFMVSFLCEIPPHQRVVGAICSGRSTPRFRRAAIASSHFCALPRVMHAFY
jgi:hypothetical protein